MTVVVEGPRSYIIATTAEILPDDREIASAWAREKVQINPAYKWILGKYVEADHANSNKQFWALDQLRMAQPTISHSPLNILHRAKHIVGAFTATEMIYPTQGGGELTEGAAQGFPYIEALAVFWKYFFPDELKVVESAANQGALYFSMECVAESLKCAGTTGCGKEFAFKGPRHVSYCDHLNEAASIKELISPHFLAGALVLPPVAPGWSNADAGLLASMDMLAADDDQLERVYNSIKAESSHLEPAAWEQLMMQLLKQAEDASGSAPKKKKKTAKMWAQDVL